MIYALYKLEGKRAQAVEILRQTTVSVELFSM